MCECPKKKMSFDPNLSSAAVSGDYFFQILEHYSKNSMINKSGGVTSGGGGGIDGSGSGGGSGGGDIVHHHHAHKNHDLIDYESILIAKGTAMIVLFFASIFFGLLPYKMRKLFKLNNNHDNNSKIIPLLLSFGGGVLLSTTFLHLLPEISENIEILQENNKLKKLNFNLTNLLMVIGFFFMYFIEILIHKFLNYLERCDLKVREKMLSSTASVNGNGNGNEQEQAENQLNNQQPHQHQSLSSMESQPQQPSQQNPHEPPLQQSPLQQQQDDDIILSTINNSCPIDTTPYYHRHYHHNHGHSHLPIITRSNYHHQGRLSTSGSSSISTSTRIRFNDNKTTNNNNTNTTTTTTSTTHNNNDLIKTSIRGLLIVLALSVHELFEGLAVGLEQTSSTVWYMFGAISAHKFVLSFCVGVELIVSNNTRLLITIIYVITFAFVSPMGIGIGMLTSNNIGTNDDDLYDLTSVILQGLASGTLLYVIFFEVFPKINRNSLLQYFTVVIGFIVMFGLQFASKCVIIIIILIFFFFAYRVIFHHHHHHQPPSIRYQF